MRHGDEKNMMNIWKHNITFTKLKVLFSHLAPEDAEIETYISSMSILEENMELFK